MNVGISASRFENDLAKALASIVGADNLLTDPADTGFYANDVYSVGEAPLAVVRPADAREVAQIVAHCAKTGTPIIPRGGGASYTDGYLHRGEPGITIDTALLDSIEIDDINALVIVGAGVTWAKLREVLDAKGWRTPFWGPFSGFAATVGGSVSQNAVSHGTGAFGVSAESVQGIEVVVGEGEVLRTGTWGKDGGKDEGSVAPFLRFSGPDMAGLFTGDCGLLGVKTRIALRMIRKKPEFEAISFNFASFEAMHTATRKIAAAHLDDEGFGLDQALQQGQIAKQSGASNKAAMALAIMRSSPSWRRGATDLLRMARAGDRELQAAPYAMHYMIDGIDRYEARAKVSELRRIGTQHGREIPNTVPNVVRAMPFAPLFNTLGPKGELWVPIHGVLAHDAVPAFHEALTAYRASRAADMERLGIWHGNMFATVGSSGFLYEPATYWRGPRSAYHERVIPADYLATLPVYEREPEADAMVAQMKGEMIDLMQEHGAAHFQLGKVYPYTQGRNSASLDLLRAVKAQLDPHGIFNPGALGI